MAITSKTQVEKLHAWRDNNICLEVQQGEGGIKIAEFQLVDDNGIIPLNTASAVLFNGVKSNGKGCAVNCSILDSSKGTIEFKIETGMTDIDGLVKGNIEVVSQEGSLKFGGVNLRVAKSNTSKLIEADKAFSVLVEMLNRIKDITPEGTILLDTEINVNSLNPVSGKTIKDYLNRYSYIYDTGGRIVSYSWDNVLTDGSFSISDDDKDKGLYICVASTVTEIKADAFNKFSNIQKIYVENVSGKVNVSALSTDIIRKIIYRQNSLMTFYMLASLALLHREKSDKTEVDSALINSNKGKTTFALYSNFVRANARKSDGSLDTNVRYRVTSENIMKFDYDLNVSVDNGFTAYVVQYSNGSYVSIKSLSDDNGWTILAETEFRLHIRRNPENTSEIANINEFVNAVHFQTKIASDVETIGKALDETTQTVNSVSEIVGKELKVDKEINRTETHTTTPFVCVAHEFKKGLSYTIKYNASAPLSSIATTLINSISSSDMVDVIATGNLQNGTVTFSPRTDGAKYLTFKGVIGAAEEKISLTITGKITSSLLGKTVELDDSVNNIEEVINSKVYSDNQFSGSHGSGFVTFPFNFEMGKQYKISYKTLNDGSVTFIYNQTANNINGSSRVDIISTPNAKEGEVYYTPSDNGGKYLAFRCDSDLAEIECNVSFSINENIGMLKKDVKTLKDDVETLKNDKDPAEIPDYYYENNYIDDKIQTIKEKSSYKHGVSFIFISDLHFLQNQNQSKKLIKKILDETNVPFVLCGGDLIYLTGTQEQLDEQIAEFNEFKSCIGKDRLFCTRGNHELYNQTGTGAEAERHDYTNGTVYDLLFRDSENRVTNMSIKNMCYCIDNDIQKTRIIMLNTSDMTSDVSSTAGGIMFRGSTLEWLKNALNEKENYNIIIVSHHHINSENFVNQAGFIIDDEINYDFNGESPNALFNMVKAFKERTAFSATQFNVTCEADFTNNTNNLICIVSGHRHKDRYSEQDGILNTLTTCDCIDVKDGYNRTAGTISEQAFDVFCIDYDTNTINIVRVGAGKDRKFDCTANKSLFDKITPIGTPVITDTAEIANIEPNKFYRFGEVTDLELTLAVPKDNSILNEYMFEFVSGKTATTLTLPDTVKWIEPPTIEANKKYQVSILNNMGLMVGFDYE